MIGMTASSIYRKGSHDLGSLLLPTSSLTETLVFGLRSVREIDWAIKDMAPKKFVMQGI
jgi:hypothetical protein